MENNLGKRKEIWIEIMRAFACICVLLIHSPVSYDGYISGQYLLAPANYLFMAWGVSLFFMISGSVLFAKSLPLQTFYKRRFSRILLPILIWSVIYIIFDDFFKPSDKSLINRLLMIPLTHQSALLWFMYTLVGIYLVAPILSKWLESCSKRDLEIVLGLWGITLLLPYLTLLDPDCAKIISGNGVLHHFYGFIGYALLGYYLRFYVTVRIWSWQYLVMVLVAFIFPICVYISGLLPLDTLNTSMSLSSALMSVVAFLFFKDLNYKDGRVLRVTMKVAEFSFGIYLCHMLFLTPLKYWLMQFHIHYALQIPLTALVVGCFSYLFVWGLSKLRYSKWIFG